jgi:hypothetical protein
MSYTPQNASKRAYRRFKRKFHNDTFAGIGLVRFVLYWFAIRRMKKDRAGTV